MSGLTLTKDVLTDFGYTIRSEVVDLSSQNIGDIAINAFEDHEQLTKINLSGNQIEFIPLGAFSQNAKLTDLSLANNKLRAFHADVLNGAVGLETLDLSGNPLESFDVSLTETLCLQSLNLDNTGVAAHVQLKRVGRCLRATWV
ncbi:Leucine Rich Repeat (LRR) protein [Roseiarcus fermentans]|uniref:Leucine Rich Repeat (LRR) protein n=1 Tax=Roseiarcus fermentans TaxID=1473586 RepID=A0A366FA61_9HYPH|nr:leucine-rich repeat domain-containing protein [Roseiarcus fermentans]RBP10605.1 Leucine Rich Repeat (LRR) protein [Roseiarcus fermentans]